MLKGHLLTISRMSLTPSPEPPTTVIALKHTGPIPAHVYVCHHTGYVATNISMFSSIPHGLSSPNDLDPAGTPSIAPGAPGWVRPENNNKSFKTPQYKMPEVETPEQKALIDKLYLRYLPVSGKANLRCLIRFLVDPLFVEQWRQMIVAELDQYTGGKGCTEAKVAIALKNPFAELSVFENHCLVRADPFWSPRGYDSRKLSVHCLEHNTQHQWCWQKGYIDAAFLGLYNYTVPDDVEHKLVEILGWVLNGSHTCHNHRCSDPFTLAREHSFVNMGRNICRRDLRHPCLHIPRCRRELEWADNKSDIT